MTEKFKSFSSRPRRGAAQVSGASGAAEPLPRRSGEERSGAERNGAERSGQGGRAGTPGGRGGAGGAERGMREMRSGQRGPGRAGLGWAGLGWAGLAAAISSFSLFFLSFFFLPPPTARRSQPGCPSPLLRRRRETQRKINQLVRVPPGGVGAGAPGPFLPSPGGGHSVRPRSALAWCGMPSALGMLMPAIPATVVGKRRLRLQSTQNCALPASDGADWGSTLFPFLGRSGSPGLELIAPLFPQTRHPFSLQAQTLCEQEMLSPFAMAEGYHPPKMLLPRGEK